MLGNSLTYFAPNRRRSKSDRINVSVQRQLPGSIVLDVTYFLNHTGQMFQNGLQHQPGRSHDWVHPQGTNAGE